ncbi:MAG: hypothetical protein P8Y54_13200 [Xanthomonadales bacterium]
MLDRHECELISAGLDGELAPGEQREHDELLASSAEARALRAELRGVGAALESLPEQAPPADLAERVLARAAPRDAKVTPLRPRWRRAHVPLAFAAGLLVAVAVSRLLPVGGSPLEQQWMSGTLAPAARLPGHAEQRIDADGLTGSVRLGQRGGTRSLEFRVEATGPVEIEVDLNGTGRTFGGVVVAEDGPGPGRIEFAGGTVRVAGGAGAAFGLLLPATAAHPDHGEAVRVAIRSDGRTRFETAFGE